jgi:acyl-CoA thioesterase
MDASVEQMEHDRFAKHLGLELVEVAPGRARVSMRVGPEHRNSVGMVHGGVIFTVADYAFAVACNSHGTLAVAVDCHVSYLRTPEGETLAAEATEVWKSRRLGTYEVKVTDGEGNLVATFQGMAYRKDVALGEAGAS